MVQALGLEGLRLTGTFGYLVCRVQILEKSPKLGGVK